MKFLKLGSNPNGQLFNGNTCLHLSTINGHIECIRHLLKFGGNPFLENSLGLTPWNNLSQLNETIELECLQLFVDLNQSLPPADLIFDAIERDHINTYDYLLSITHEELKRIQSNTTDSLAYNYFIPSQNLKNFIRYIEQNPYVGVYGAAYLQKKALFEDLMRYLERPMAFSTSAKFQVVKFEFESVTSLDDCIDELVEQNFLRTNQWSNEQQSSTKYLLYFANIQNSAGTDVLKLLLNGESSSGTCQKVSYTREEDSKSTIVYYFPSMFHIFITMSKRTWSTEHEVYKKFKWIPFKLENPPWNGLLKRHLWRRMIDINIRENRSVDNELIKTLQWVTNVWQRYNECLQKLSLQDALLGPALFFDCPMERENIFEWLQTKWNTIVAPLVREFSMNKCAQPKPKASTSATAAATAIASSLRANSLEISTPYESVACTALYVLLHRAVSRDCPLTGQEREQYLLNFVGSRLEGSSSSSMISSAASSRAGTPQPSNYCDFVSIQLE
ncbi:unnamed protein product [Rotaria socialis]|uniref:CortBP2/NAV1-like AAA+ ATPase lid domain-containing protein n=1 Tax=Rotaria socialis TaxID=392032 RepID=A0A820JSB7_9BILA|nr:unnamed protein product [Rotaria socialis]